ncbi:hypothetical protein [Mangrovicoccus ximenensis]|uniref:hypothetical protein n=1 Tax=Mangrovicoccus ximenensis TaxID=1911570 RepID=UPI001374B5BD|nr:hypothetical protein [Mangrovicoccus ximenensis]
MAPQALAVPDAARLAEFLVTMRDAGLNPSMDLPRSAPGSRLRRGLAADRLRRP